jgi:hypothetical protein
MTLLDDIRPSVFLQRVLAADAATCVATGLLMLFGAGALAPWLGIPPTLMRYAGASLLPIAAFIASVAARDSSPRVLVWAVIAGNAAWSQALVVALFAELEFVGLRRSSAFS